MNIFEQLGIKMPTYPTKEEIIKEEQLHKPEILLLIKTWKKSTWRDARHNHMIYKFTAIEELLLKIAEIYGKPVNVIFKPEMPSCAYCSETKTIIINQSVSIISSLHEMAHHLFGKSELKACRWSIWLFKKTFPRAFENLIWQGHVLIKPEVLPSNYEPEQNSI